MLISSMVSVLCPVLLRCLSGGGCIAGDVGEGKCRGDAGDSTGRFLSRSGAGCRSGILDAAMAVRMPRGTSSRACRDRMKKGTSSRIYLLRSLCSSVGLSVGNGRRGVVLGDLGTKVGDLGANDCGRPAVGRSSTRGVDMLNLSGEGVAGWNFSGEGVACDAPGVVPPGRGVKARAAEASSGESRRGVGTRR